MTTDLGLGLRHDDDDVFPPRRRSALTRFGRVVVLLTALLVILGIVAVGVVGVRAVARRFPPADYSGPGKGSVVVQVRTGDTAGDIGVTLAAADVVKSADAFRRAAASDDRSRTIQPGYYRVRAQLPAAAALGLLLQPSARLSSRVVVPEGTTLPKALLALSAGARIPLADLRRVAAHPAALGVPATCGGQLEGCLFPATYLFQPGTTATDALSQMVDRFGEAAAAVGLDAGAKALHVRPYQVLVIASLLEKEAALPQDFPKVARVVYNRLARGMPLQFDSTVVYALNRAKGHLSIADTRIASPYNTYLHKGLPPTPINSPGEVALRAALHPTAGNWLYFLTVDKAGHTAFTSSYAQFQRLKAAGIR